MRVCSDSRLRVVFLQTGFPPARSGDSRTLRNVPLAPGRLAAALTNNEFKDKLWLHVCDWPHSSLASDSTLMQHLLALKPDVLCATAYLWNIERQRYIAGEMKKRNPRLLTLGGGPEFECESPAQVLSPFDAVVCGEGELALQAVCRKVLESGGLDGTLDPSVSSRMRVGIPTRIIRALEYCSLDSFDSPYLTGLIPMVGLQYAHFEGQRGCPYKCSYCNYGSGSARLGRMDLLAEEVRYVIKKGIQEAYFVDGVFNSARGLEPKCEALRRGGAPGTLSITVECRAETLTPEDVANMASAGVRNVEVGLQTINAKALRNLRRRNDLAAFVKGCRLLRQSGIGVKVGIIIGLPGDNTDGLGTTVAFLRKQQMRMRLVPFLLSVLPNTKLKERVAQDRVSFMSVPPHYVLPYGQWSKRSIRRAFEIARSAGAARSRPWWDWCGVVVHGRATADSWRHYSGMHLTITDKTNEDDTERLAQMMQHVMSSVTVLWIRALTVSRLTLLAAVIARLRRANPWSVFRIIIETECDCVWKQIDHLAQVTDTPAHPDEVFCSLTEATRDVCNSSILVVASDKWSRKGGAREYPILLKARRDEWRSTVRRAVKVKAQGLCLERADEASCVLIALDQAMAVGSEEELEKGSHSQTVLVDWFS